MAAPFLKTKIFYYMHHFIQIFIKIQPNITGVFGTLDFETCIRFCRFETRLAKQYVIIMSEPLMGSADMMRLNRFWIWKTFQSQTHLIYITLKISPPHTGSSAETHRSQKQWIFQIYFLWRVCPQTSTPQLEEEEKQQAAGVFISTTQKNRKARGQRLWGVSGQDTVTPIKHC